VAQVTEISVQGRGLRDWPEGAQEMLWGGGSTLSTPELDSST
jgi:hypothetical protein